MATTSTSSDNNYVMNNNIIDVADDGEELLRKVMVEVNNDSWNDDDYIEWKNQEIKPISVMSNSSTSTSTSSDNNNAVDVDDGDELLRIVMAEAMATMNNYVSSTTTSVVLPNADTNTYVDDTAAVVAAVAANSQYMELYQNHPYYCDYSNNDDDVVNDNNNDNAATAAAAAPSTTIALPVVNNYDTLSTTTSTTTTTVADVMAKSYNTNKNGDNDAVTVTTTTTNITGHDDTTATKADDDVSNDEGNTNNDNYYIDSINEGVQKIKTEPRDSVWVLYNGNNNNNLNSSSNNDDDDHKSQTVSQSRSAMKKGIGNSNDDGPTNRKRTRDQSEDDERCDDTDDSNIDINDYQAEDDEDDDDEDDDDEDDEDAFLPEDSTDSNQNKDSKSPVVRGKRRRIDNKSLHDTNWDDMFQRLVAYKEIHKNTMVPSQYDEDPSLGWWVGSQRCRYRNNDMPSNRLDLLNSIDFEWEGGAKGGNRYRIEKWDDMFQKLVAYHTLHKHTMVPARYDKDPPLANWIRTQRYHYRNNDNMPSNRLDLLNSIDFEWEGVQRNKYEKWDDMFQKLVAYHKVYKNTLVPNPQKEDPKFGRWVSAQRQNFRKNKLLKERLDKLNSIGFV